MLTRNRETLGAEVRQGRGGVRLPDQPLDHKQDRSQRTRILRVLPVLDFGGVESRLALQARLHDRSRFELHACAFHRLGAAATTIDRSGVSVHELGTDPRIRNYYATMVLFRYIRQLRPDIVHASCAEANAHSLVAARLARVPTVIVEEVGQPSHSAVAKLAFRGLYRLADSIIGVTQATCRYVVQEDRAPANRVRLIYNCADPSFFPTPPVTHPVRQATDKVFRVVLVGRLVPVKNHSTFLEAFARFARTHRTAELCIAGSGPLEDEVRRQIRSLGIDSSVRLLGFTTEVAELLHGASVFALPSWHEGCSISLIEAMAAGVPVLASRVPGNLEVMGSLGNEWSCDPGDTDGWVACLHRVYELSATAQTDLSRLAQRTAYERFSPTAYLKTLEDLYSWHARGVDPSGPQALGIERSGLQL